MPLSRLLLILALAITAAGLTLWVGLWVQGASGLPPGWTALTGVLAAALIVRLLTQRR